MGNCDQGRATGDPKRRRSGRAALLIMLVVTILYASVVEPARADVTYYYDGPAFNEGWAGPAFPSLTGSVTFETVPPGETVYGGPDVKAWTLSCGPVNLGPANGLNLTATFTFDASGKIVDWIFGAWGAHLAGFFPNYPALDTYYWPPTDPGQYDSILTGPYGYESWYATPAGVPAAGYWTAVPAPCSILLLGSGLLGLAAVRLRVWRGK
jgi:hypothetical protein